MTFEEAMEKIRDEVSLKIIVDEITGGPTNFSGNGYMYSCPFHPDKTPSFGLDDHKNVFNCLSCGVQGGVYSFVKRWIQFSEGKPHASKNEVFRFIGAFCTEVKDIKIAVVPRLKANPNSKKDFRKAFEMAKVEDVFFPKTVEEKRYYITGIMKQLDADIFLDYVKSAARNDVLEKEKDLIDDILEGVF